MSIVQAYEVIERMIISEMIDILHYDGESTIEEWADDRREKFSELNAFVITTLGYNNRRIVQGVEDAIAEAEQLISEHIQDEWGFEETQYDSTEDAEQAINFLNKNIQRSLISVFPRIGTVEQLYNRVIDLALENDSDDEIKEILHAIMLTELSQGLQTGFVQSDGIRWRLDRYVNEVEKYMYQGVFEKVLSNTLKFYGVELVKVFKYVNPRDACEELQNSGIICIVPRSEASEKAKLYPNIHDPQHKYLEPDGHSGINCRHAWHHLGAQENKASKLYKTLDKNILSLEYKRMQFMRMVERLLNR